MEPPSQAGSASGTAELERQLAQKKAALEFKQRGVDICIMMDCTGSMVRWAAWVNFCVFVGLRHRSTASQDGAPEQRGSAESFHVIDPLTRGNVAPPCCLQSHCIQQVKSKAREICDLAPTLHPDAITRLVRLIRNSSQPPPHCHLRPTSCRTKRLELLAL